MVCLQELLVADLQSCMPLQRVMQQHYLDALPSPAQKA